MKCQQCGQFFEINHPCYKYCSAKCRNKAHYKNYQKEWHKKNWEKQLLKKYSKDELVQCRICGKWFRQVGSHIAQTHGMTAREYREELGFDVKTGQLPPDYHQLKAKQAIERGGAKNLEKGKRYWFKKGDKRAGRYKRSQETLKRLKKLHLYKSK
jgi:predicted transcriptional regulator